MKTTQVSTMPPELLQASKGKDRAEVAQTEEAQDRFLTLLVTQMRNQDPLNPLDNAQVTSQLAQLSTVTGIDRLNITLQALQGDFQMSSTLQSAAMVGKTVLVPASMARLENGEMRFAIDLAEPADKVEVSVRDAAGKVVRTMDLDGGSGGVIPLAWDGITDAGTMAANGAYALEVKAVRGASGVGARTLAYGKVESVFAGAGGARLEVQGAAVALADVREIR